MSKTMEFFDFEEIFRGAERPTTHQYNYTGLYSI